MYETGRSVTAGLLKAGRTMKHLESSFNHLYISVRKFQNQIVFCQALKHGSYSVERIFETKTLSKISL
jgi:hypothetical protein